jgi:long-chain acyl-CoA synthetase
MITSDLRPWLKNYPQGVPANINPDAYPNLTVLLNDTFKKFRTRPAFSCMGKELTFDEIDRYSNQLAAYFHSRGLEPGDKIALMMPNLLQYPIALFAAVRAGLVIVNTNPLYTTREMKHQFVDSGAKAIIIAENFAANLEQIIAETPIKMVMVTSIGEMLGLKGTFVNFMVRTVKKMVPKYNLPNVITVKEGIEAGKKFSIKPFKIKPEDIVAFQYTGGTTGVSKGAMLSHRNLVANMMQMRALMAPSVVEGAEICLSPLPLYHIFAFTVNCLGFFSMGGLNVLVTNARDLPSVMKEFKNYKITAMTGVNTLFNALLNHKDFAELDFSALKMTVGGGTAVQRAVAEKWKKVTKCALAEGFGMTETSQCASCNPFDGSGKLNSIGMPLPSTDMRIVDEDGTPLATGSTGEIQVKGPQVMKGYYNLPDETANVLKEGWLCTGDIGLMDKDGYFRIVDRKKDMILVSGFNVYPNEIEDVMALHAKVLESAAIGVPDEKSGEVPKVFVVRKDKSLTEKEVIEHCKANLTGYKVPKFVEFRDDLPKTNVGKILRRELRGS